jgi:hypothetical protein
MTDEQLRRIETKLDQLLAHAEEASQQWVPMAAAAAHLGVSVSTFKRRLAAGLIPAEAIRNTNEGGERPQWRFNPELL